MTVGGTERTLTYDTNGNVTEERVAGGATRTYQWDSLNRLIAIQSDKVPVPGSWRTEFAYDGQSRRVGIVEKIREDSGWTTESSARYLWEGTEIIQKRDATGSTVTAKYFDQGEIRVFGSSTIPYYFTRDHLGSVREVVNQGGVIAQSFDYTAWGERTSSTAGALEWGFTGHHYHEKSGLCLAMYRAYDANLGRWLSEDPIGEAGGLNLYGYVGNGPLLRTDLLGLDPGKPYRTKDEAAFRALQRCYRKSVDSDREYGGWLYPHPDGGWTYTEPVAGEKSHMDSSKIPKPATADGAYHTHGAEIPNDLTPENFSTGPAPSDEAWAKANGDLYLATPEGSFGKCTKSGAQMFMDRNGSWRSATEGPSKNSKVFGGKGPTFPNRGKFFR